MSKIKAIIPEHSRKPLLFLSLSGLGWIFDLALFSVLLRVFGFSPFLSNLVSSCAAATIVYLVFGRSLKKDSTLLGAATYVAYQIIIIIIFSALLVFVYYKLVKIDTLTEYSGELAKMIITIPNLVCNYVVSNFLLTRFPK